MNKLKEFAKDGIISLKYDELKELFESKEDVIPRLIKIINFNPKKPQHHNILYDDKKSSTGAVYENRK